MAIGDKPEPHTHAHSHMWLVGALSLIAGLVLLIYVPTLPAVSRTLLLFAGFHLVGALVLGGSLYIVAGARIMRRLGGRRSAKFDFGWHPAWTYGPWVAALVFAAAAVAVQVAAPMWWPLAMVALLFAASFFAGGTITRSSGRYASAVLPMTEFISAGEGLLLDAGCGAGRTTVALGRALKRARIIALDRFGSDYIEDGGRPLLEHNLRIAGLTNRVEIRQGDIMALPFENACLDGAVSVHAVDHLGSQTERGLREIFRVLKPGAPFLLVVWAPGWTMFAVANVLALSLASPRTWRRRTKQAGFTIGDEGTFNGHWFVALKKPEA
ncbi:MAG: class I SAM-dependent methyltransferase [Alphaproteobacteria bacterium]|nr:class I SAM-dependent methyltransferase [Alphaproteobacteria bacterium]